MVCRPRPHGGSASNWRVLAGVRAAATPACAGAGDGADDCVTDVLFTVDADPQADWRQEVVLPLG